MTPRRLEYPVDARGLLERRHIVICTGRASDPRRREEDSHTIARGFGKREVLVFSPATGPDEANTKRILFHCVSQ